MNRSWLRFVFPVLIAAGLLAYCSQSRSPAVGPGATSPAASGSGSATPSSWAALLEGLAVGDTIEDFRVERIYLEPAQNNAPQLAIDFGRSGSGITVWVTRKEVAQKPPIVTERYAISHGHERPFGAPIPEGSSARMADKIAERVRRSERNVPLPSGLE